eukprot:g76090.t1
MEGKLSEEQGGFRPNRPTMDQIISLHEALVRRRRSIPFGKMASRNDCGKVEFVAWRIIRDAYRGIRMRVLEFAKETPSPVLFLIFVDALAEILAEQCKGLAYSPEGPATRQQLQSLLYADNVVMLADLPEELNAMIEVVRSFCDTWRIDQLGEGSCDGSPPTWGMWQSGKLLLRFKGSREPSDCIKSGTSAHSQPATQLAHTQQLPRAPRHDQPGVLTRLRLLLARELLYDLREPGAHLLRLLELTVLGLFTGSLYYKLALDPLMLTEWAGLLFFSMWSVLFSGIAGTPVIVADRFVIKEEYLNGTYGIGTYAVAKFVSALPFHALAALIYQALVWGLADVTDDVGVFCFQLLVAALLLVFMEGVVMCVAEVAKEPMLTTSFSMIFLGCLFLFSGFFIKLDDMPLPTRWIPESLFFVTRYNFMLLLFGFQ